MRKTNFYNDGYYHVYNRGVDKRKIFLNDHDRIRFLSCVNDFRFKQIVNSAEFNKYVEIVAFCLMPNHFHILLKQLSDNGVSKFMHKIGTGYTMYFNKKNDRSGSLFEGRFRSVEIGDSAQFDHLTRYIHLNPIKLIYPDWKERGVKNIIKASQFIRNYQWSSYREYINESTEHPFINHGVVSEILKDFENYEKFVLDWLK